MANGLFVSAKGRFIQWSTLSVGTDAVIALLIKSSGLQSDATLTDHATLAALLAASNDEADFTNYVRKVVANVTVVLDTSANTAKVTVANLTWTAAGGATNNTLGKLITCYRPDAASPDAAIIPLSYHDCTVTTTGSDLLISVSSGTLATAA